MAAPTITKKKRRPTGASPERHHLVVISRDGAVPLTLPVSGEVLIGRDENADVRIIDPLASRQHARIIIGDPIRVEDLGSRNGTRLHDQALEPRVPTPYTLGDALAIGDTALILQGGEPELDEPRVWAHDYIETRLVEECARAQSRGAELALARIHVGGTQPSLLAEQLLCVGLRDGHLLARYAPGEYEALMVDCSEVASRALATTLVAALGAKGLTATCGLALYPADGTSPQALLGCASERVRAAAPGQLIAVGAGVVSRRPATPLVPVPAADANGGRDQVVVDSPAMRELYALARRAAAGTSSVLIVGETGVGKEVLAEEVHRASPRTAQAFLPLNCAAFSETLVESELFGFERGSFTGANQTKIGLLEAASGGTLFLDEIGEMSLAIQAKLLRVIETRQVMRIGATRPRPIDVRFVAATNRDLEEEVSERRFREDLFFRLNVIQLEIPPLRERPEELEALARLFLDRLAKPTGRPAPRLTAEALAVLRDYAWPGNVRELRNVVERAFILCPGEAPAITPEHLPVEKLSRHLRTPAEAAPALARSSTAELTTTFPIGAGEMAAARVPYRGLKQLERDAMVDALQRCHGNQTRAAELLGMPRRTFCKRIKEFQIPRPRS